MPAWIFCSCCRLKASAHNACLPLTKGTLNILLCSCLAVGFFYSFSPSVCTWLDPAGPLLPSCFPKGTIIGAQRPQEPSGFPILSLAPGRSSPSDRAGVMLWVSLLSSAPGALVEGVCAAPGVPLLCPRGTIRAPAAGPEPRTHHGWVQTLFGFSWATQRCRKCSRMAHSVFPEAVLWFQQPGCSAGPKMLPGGFAQ